jgi:hypothetical protein
LIGPLHEVTFSVASSNADSCLGLPDPDISLKFGYKAEYFFVWAVKTTSGVFYAKKDAAFSCFTK